MTALGSALVCPTTPPGANRGMLLKRPAMAALFNALIVLTPSLRTTSGLRIPSPGDKRAGTESTPGAYPGITPPSAFFSGSLVGSPDQRPLMESQASPILLTIGAIYLS